MIGFICIFPGPVKAKPTLTVEFTTSTDSVNQYPGEAHLITNSSYPGKEEGSSDMDTSNGYDLGKELQNLKVTKSEAPMLAMILSKPFALLYIMNTLSVFTGFFAVNNFKQYGIKNGLTNESYLAWVGSVAAVMNSIRFVWSFATDHFSYKTVYSVMLVMQIVLDFTIPLVAENDVFFAIWVALLLLCEGGHFTIVPNVLKKIYGEKGTALYGILFSYSGICAILMVIF